MSQITQNMLNEYERRGRPPSILSKTEINESPVAAAAFESIRRRVTAEFGESPECVAGAYLILNEYGSMLASVTKDRDPSKFGPEFTAAITSFGLLYEIVVASPQFQAAIEGARRERDNG